MRSTKWMINLGIILVFAALIGIIFSDTDAAGPLTSSANTPRQEFDFGDAPDPTYPTLLNSNGAHHQIVEGIHLGEFIDGEADGWPDAAALGDDLDQDPDDEDGGLFSSPLFTGQTASLDVTASTEGRLDAWLDFNRDGDWSDNGEQIFQARLLQPGLNNLSFNVPPDAATGLTFSRLRFSLAGELLFEGPAPEGEVEDYRVDIQIPSQEPGWAKWVNDEAWSPDLLVGVETSQTITVTDVITTFTDFYLREDWNPAHLTLRDFAVTAGNVERGDDFLEWFGAASPSGVVTLTKWFHVEPCTWDATVLYEFLEVPIVPFSERPVAIEKEAPMLSIDVEKYDPEVLAGQLATFTLLYGNEGGNETGVTIWNDFALGAPFIDSIPPPNETDPEGTFAMWDIGELGSSVYERITVTVEIAPTLEPSTTVVITDYIRDHTGADADWVYITYHVTEPPPGRLDGHVMDSELGDLVPTCTQAEVLIEPGGLTVPADPTTGYYGPVELPPGSYTVTAAAPGYSTETDVVDITSGITTTYDFNLWRPMIEVRPTDFISVTAWVNQPVVYSLEIGNKGHEPLDFEIVELPEGTDLPWVWQDPISGTIPGPGQISIDVTFHCPEPGEYEGMLRIFHTDPCADPVDLPILLHCRAPEWEKWVNGQLWYPEPQFVLTVETSDTVTVTDVIRSDPADRFVLTEHWTPDELRLTGYSVDPPFPTGVITAPAGIFVWDVPPEHPAVITLTKLFHVEPCNWPETILAEALQGLPVEPLERSVVLEKNLPILWIDVDEYDPEVVAGLPTTFTLLYGNDGGYENDVMIRNDFPREAPFVSSEPAPDRQDPDGLWIEWDVGNLEMEQQDRISVTVAISPLLPISTPVTIVDYIYDHTDEEADLVEIPFHVAEPPKADWEKLVNGGTWVPEMALTLQTSQTFTVTDIITTLPKARFILRETWNPDHLTLRDAHVDPPEASHLIPGPDSLEWHVGVDHAEALTLTKVFHVEPCNWPDTLLLEELVGLNVIDPVRPVVVEKIPPDLWIDVDEYNPEVTAGDPVSFTLLYGNDGGFENDVMIRNDFPPGAPFVSSEPAPDRKDLDGLWVEWDVGNLAMQQSGRLTVTAEISPLLQPTTTVTIVDYIYDHMDEPVRSVEVPFHVARPPVGEWKKQVNGRTWVPDMAVTVQTSQTITVTDVITTHPGAPFHLTEAWNPEHLTLLRAYVDPPQAPQPSPGPDSLDWRVEPDHAEALTLTKVFHVEPCDWPSTILEEALEGLTVPDPVREVTLNKMPPNLWIGVADYNREVAAGDLVSFTLLYGNDGGFENDVMIRNDFPPGAPFVSSEPAPDRKDLDGLWVEWDVGNLEMEQKDRISVTVAIDPLLQPTTTVTIVDYIYDHMDEPVRSVEVPFHVARPPVGEWKKQVNGRTWVPDMAVTVQTSQTITVTDVITTHPGAPFHLTEAWNPEHLTLLRAYVDPPQAPQPSPGPDFLDWRVEPDHAQVLTLTKVFHVEPGNWRITVLHEELEGLDVINPVREVSFTMSFRLFMPIIARNYTPTALEETTSPTVPRMIPVVMPTLVRERLDQAEAPARPPTRFNRRRTIPR